jgi:hypothetical protein
MRLRRPQRPSRLHSSTLWPLYCGLPSVLCLLVLLALPASAAATAGSIEGVSIAPDLAVASVSSLDLSYDECTAEVPDCTWTATAMLAPPQRDSCTSTWSLLEESEANPPGLPDPPPGSYRERHIWGMDFSGNGARQSGPLTFGLEGANDFRLCLYATHFSEPSVYPPTEPPNLIAEHLLHVDLPPIEETQTQIPAPPPACKKHRIRQHGKCMKRKRGHHHHHHKRGH